MEEGEENKPIVGRRVDTMQLIHSLTKTPLIKELGVKPSVYLKTLLDSGEETRCVEVGDLREVAGGGRAPQLGAAGCSWELLPATVLFTGWTLSSGTHYQAHLSLRNKRRVSRQVTGRLKASDVFSLERLGTGPRRVPPLLTAQFRVRFKPKELVDYLDTIHFSSESEDFEVFIVAIAPRPIINFPDRIEFEDALVNFTNKKEIQLKNIGHISTTVTFETIGSVWLSEDRLRLRPGEERSLSVSLNSTSLGFVNAQIIATYETGERVYINVTADCQRGDIELETRFLRLERTYVGLKSTKSLRVRNRTRRLLEFRWLRTEDIWEDDLLRNRFSDQLNDLMDMNRYKSTVLTELSQQEHTSIWDKVREDETATKHRFYFIDSCFHISPVSGSLWPESELYFQISFLPTKATTYRTVAYLEVDGLAQRVKVVLEGEAIGPSIALNVSLIDTGKLFLCSVHTYVVMARNTGHVKGTLRYSPEERLCGGEIDCTPASLELLPNDTKLIEIRITSSIPGHFVEDITFQVLESTDKAKITIKGEIINPRIKLDRGEINFGDIAVGIPFKEKLTLSNESTIGVEVGFRVTGDGTMPVVRIDYEDFDLLLPTNPREFSVEPEEAHIQSGASLDFEITVISNRVRRQECRLDLYLRGVLMEESSVPLVYNSVIPRVTINPPEIVMRYAFTGYEYIHKLTVCNESNLPTYFLMLPQEPTFNPYILYRLENETGYLGEQSCQMVKVLIKVLSLKPCKETIRMKIFGVSHPTQACLIKAYGMGPVVNPSVFQLNWGPIPIMEEVEKKLQLINVSPIPAYYKVNIMKHSEVFSAEEKEGQIGAESSAELVVRARLGDSGPISDQLWVEITGSRDLHIDLSAIGQGISIVTEPNIFPLYNIGNVFRHEKQKKIIKVSNVGTKHHTLLFTTSKDFKKMTKLTAAKEQGQYFKLDPYRLDLPGGASQDIVLTFKWDEEAVLEDTYYCYGTIGNTGKRITFGVSTIRAVFTDPQFFAEPPEVLFRTDVSEDVTLIGPLHKKLTLKSLWNTKLTVECRVPRPFRFGPASEDGGGLAGKPLEAEEAEEDAPAPASSSSTLNLTLEPGIPREIDLYFDPPQKTRRTKVLRDALLINYIGHTVKTTINLIGEVNFPNVYISTKLADFGCTAPGGEAVLQIYVKNTSPLPVSFEWLWEKSEFTFLKVPVSETPKGQEGETARPKVPLLEETLSETSQGTPDGELTSTGSPPALEKSLAPRGRSSFYRNLLSEKYYCEDGKLPQNLEVLVTELLMAKYEYEKMVEGPQLKKRREFRVDWEKQFDLTHGQADFSSIGIHGSTGGSLDMKGDGESESSECGLSEGLKQTLGLEEASTASTFSIHQLVSLIDQMPSDSLNKETIENLYKCIKKEDKLEVMSDDTLDISKLIDISPCCEMLEPRQCLATTLTFCPTTALRLRATAACRVRGGPAEHLDCTAAAYPLLYQVFPSARLNFGVGPFCEMWCSSILIWNKSLKEINVALSTPNSLTFRGQAESSRCLPHSVGIHPAKKVIKPFESSFHQIFIYPGHVGEIDQDIIVEIENEEPVHVHLLGYATPHQLHVAVPHSLFIEEDRKMYNSIARMTSSWFEFDLKEILKIPVSHEELDEILTEIELKYAVEDWDLLMSRHDLVPSADDINMAYERYLCEEYCKTLENVSSPHSQNRASFEALMGFVLPPYVIDFGLVIVGTKAHYNIPITNFTSMKTVMKINPPKNGAILDKFGVTFKLPEITTFKPYEEKFFELSMRPLKDIYRGEEFERTMVFDFSVEVSCGGNFPIIVKALVTHPVLKAPTFIDFEGVKIGYRRIIKFKLKNISKVDCEWTGEVVAANYPAYYLESRTRVRPKNCPFFIQPVRGYLSPNHYTVISAVFEPIDEIPYEVDIHFYANMNNKYVKVRLRGYGMEPKLLVRSVDFGYSIPFSKPLKKRLNVYNPALFPLEVFIVGEDKRDNLEKTISSWLVRYHGTQQVCVPSVFFKRRMSEEMYVIFKKLAKAAIQKYILDISHFMSVIVCQYFNKTQGKPISSSDSGAYDPFMNKFKLRKFNSMKSSPGDWASLLKSPKKKLERKQSLKSVMTRFELVTYLIQRELPRRFLGDVLKEYVETTNSFDCGHFNFTESFTKQTLPDEDLMKDGNIIILHSSPYSYPGTFSWIMNKLTGVKPISIDRVIYAEIREGQSMESLMIREILCNFYLQESNDRIFSTDTQERSLPGVVTWKDLIKFALTAGRTGEEHRFHKNLTPPTTLLNIPSEYLRAILERRLLNKLRKGIIIRQLSSKFFATPLDTLELLLDLFRTYKNLNVVSLYTATDQKLRLNKDAINPNLIEYFEKMTGTNILDASPSFVKRFGEEHYDQRKLIMKGFPNDDMRSKSSRKAASTKISVSSHLSRRGKLKTKPFKLLKIMEAEGKFKAYQKELFEMQELLEDYERVPRLPENALSVVSISSMSQIVRQTKKIEYMRKLPLFAGTKADLKVDEKVGVPFWILYNFPYSEDYQFSTYAEYLSHSGLVKNYRDPMVAPVHGKFLSDKSYYVLKRASLDSERPPLSATQDDFVFTLTPIIKKKNKKAKKKMILSDSETIHKKEENIKESSNPTVEAQSKSNESLTIAMMKIQTHCMSLEDDLKAELEGLMGERSNSRTSRRLVRPSRFVSWEVEYRPLGCRQYTKCVPLGLGGCSSLQCATLTAGSDIPDILFEPDFLFPQVIEESVTLDEISTPCFLLEQNLFHFGMIIAYSSGGLQGDFETSCPVKIHNISHVDVELMVTLLSEDKFVFSGAVTLMADLSARKTSTAGKTKKMKKKKGKAHPSSKTLKKKKVQKSRKSCKFQFEEKSHFVTSHRTLQVKPGETKILTMSASPIKPGLQSVYYMLSIENNPKVYYIKAVCLGIIPHVEFRPKELAFEEVVLYRSLSKCFVIDNTSEVPLIWKVLETVPLTPPVVLSKYEGFLKSAGQDTVSVTFQANSVERVCRDLIITVFSPYKSDLELQRHYFRLVLKAYSVDVNFHFELSGSDVLSLGNIGIQDAIVTNLVIENCGTHSVFYNILVNEEELTPFKNSFNVSISEEVGGLKSKEINRIKMTIAVNGEIRMTAVPFIIIEVMDFSLDELIARIPGHITLQSFFPQYLVRPSQVLNFGDMEIGTLLSLEIIIENTGSIEFNFDLVPPIKRPDEEYPLIPGGRGSLQFLAIDKVPLKDNLKSFKSILKNLKSLVLLKKLIGLQSQKIETQRAIDKLKLPIEVTSRKKLRVILTKHEKNNMACNIRNRLKIYKKLKSTADSRWKENEEESCLDLGKLAHDGILKARLLSFVNNLSPFDIKLSRGTVAPGESVTCVVDCWPQYEGTFKKTVNLLVQNESRKDNPMCIELQAKCSQPRINFEDYDSMFREFEVVDTFVPKLNVRNEGFPFGYFCKSEKAIIFCNVLVGSSEHLNVYLKSENHLICTVKVLIFGDSTFSVENCRSYVCSVRPYETACLPIAFSPVDLNDHEATIEFSLTVQKTIVLKVSTFVLRGTGSIPSLEIEQPRSEDSPLPQPTTGLSPQFLAPSVPQQLGGVQKVDFKYTHLGSTTKRTFSLRNSGAVICDFWLEIPFKPQFFKIVRSKEAARAALNSTVMDTFDASTLFRLKPGESISFETIFTPYELGVFSVNINVHLIYNPYEILCLRLYGEAFENEVLIRGLECDSLSTGSFVTSTVRQDFPMQYRLDFGCCPVGGSPVKNFIIQNSTPHVVRFEILTNDCRDVLFVPSTGHIFHSSMKEISASLLTSSPGSFTTLISVIYNGIVYKEEPVTIKEWDNAPKAVVNLDYRDSSNERTEPEATEEPPVGLLSLLHGELYLLASGVIDKPAIELSTRNITFPYVLVGHAKTDIFTVTNVSKVDVAFSVDILDRFSSKTPASPETDAFTFGNFNYTLKKSIDLDEEEPPATDSDYMWPHSLPPDQELADYKRLFMSRERKEELRKWDYLRLKQEVAGGGGGEACEPSQPGRVSHFIAAILDRSHQQDSQIDCRSEDGGVGEEGEGESGDGQTTVLTKKTFSRPELQPPQPAAPFYSSVRHTSLAPAQSLDIQVTFTPPHIKIYSSELRLSLSEDEAEFEVYLRGAAFLPLCHMEIPENNYLEENQVLLKRIPQETKVFTITSFSQDTVVKRTFNVFNTSDITYHFKWYCLRSSTKEDKIKFYTKEGIIQAHDHAEMMFSFCPVSYGTYESLWLFCIREFVLQQPILVVGIAKEPQVVLNPRNIYLRPIYAGSKTIAEVKVINHENIPVAFSINEDSYYIQIKGLSDSFTITPKKGRIKPRDSTKLLIEYCPRSLREDSFWLPLEIQPSGKVISLIISIKKFMIVPLISCLKENFEKIDLSSNDKPESNIISLGKIPLLTAYKLNFTVKNGGEMPLHFKCSAEDKEDESLRLEIEQETGIVFPSKHFNFFVQVTPLKKVTFRHPLLIKISGGPTFHIILTGSPITPLYDFSFDTYDFGVCVIQKTEPLLHTTVLKFSNLGTDPVLLEQLGSCKEAFSINFTSILVDPRSSTETLIAFLPTEAKKYKETILFKVGNIFEHSITLTGEGDYFSVEVEEPENNLVELGLVKSGVGVRREVALLNRSRATVSFTIYSQGRNTWSTNTKLDVEPLGKTIKLSPDEHFVVHISFYGTERTKDYSAAVMYQAYGEKGVLFSVRGTVIDYEISLDQSALLFSATSVGCSSTLKVALRNSGDIGTRFKFDTSLVSEVFLVKPARGYISPGTNVILEVTFIPNAPMQYHNNLLLCQLKNYQTQALTITGTGVLLPTPSLTVKFVSEVRQFARNLITLKNNSQVEVVVEPEVDGEYFSNSGPVTIPPLGQHKYEICYHPLTQTKHHYHIGSAFCSFPNGESCLYKLLGTALPPKYTATLSWHCSAGQKIYGNIRMDNVYPAPETYKISIACSKASSPLFYHLEAPETLVIPAQRSRNCTIGILCWKACLLQFKVMIANQTSSEYKLFRVQVEVAGRTAEDPASHHRRTVYPREILSHRLPLHNPLPRPTLFLITTPSSRLGNVFIKKKILRIKAGKTKMVRVKCVATQGEVENFKFRVENLFLGTSRHELFVKVLEPRLSPLLTLEANIGTPANLSLQLTNPLKALVSCLAEADLEDLIFTKVFTIPPRRTYKLQITLNPSFIGALLKNITIITDKIGIFCYTIKCVGYPPKPQGTYFVPHGGTLKLNFTNPFNERTSFTCEQNSQGFLVRATHFTLNANESLEMEVQHLARSSFHAFQANVSCCKVTVSCPARPLLFWRYYLRSESPLPAQKNPQSQVLI